MSIPRILQYPNPPGAPTFYPERSENDLILGLLVSPGYFFITLVLLVGLALGDTSEYGVSPHYSSIYGIFQMCLFNTFGFLLHLSAGAVEVVAAREAEANGATVGFTKSLTLHIFNSRHLITCTKNINSSIDIGVMMLRLHINLHCQAISKNPALLFRVWRHPLPLVPCVS